MVELTLQKTTLAWASAGATNEMVVIMLVGWMVTVCIVVLVHGVDILPWWCGMWWNTSLR